MATWAEIQARNEAAGNKTGATGDYHNQGKTFKDIYDSLGPSHTDAAGTVMSDNPGMDDWVLDSANHFSKPQTQQPSTPSAPAPSPAPAAPPPSAPAPAPAPAGPASPDPGPPSQAPLTIMARPQTAPPSMYGDERSPEYETGLTDRVLPASSRALSQLAASRGGRIY